MSTSRLVNRRRTIRLVHTGKTGPAGTSSLVRVYHGADADVARPDVPYVEWVGSVPPTNATTVDTWIDTA